MHIYTFMQKNKTTIYTPNCIYSGFYSKIIQIDANCYLFPDSYSASFLLSSAFSARTALYSASFT